MNIILLNPQLKTWSPNVYVPLGIAYIAAVLEREGHHLEIIDLNLQKANDTDFIKRLSGADIVGITGMITEYEAILGLVETVKKAGAGVRVILGGPLVTTIPHELLEASQADIAVLGEGEKTIVSLVSAIERGSDFSDIKGIAYRTDSLVKVTGPVEPVADLDTIPFPARHLLDMNRYLRNYFKSFGIKIKELGEIKCTNLVSSRGCPYSCTFCFKEMWGPKWRGRSPENIISEMELLYETYGINGFFFNDDTFVLDRDRIFKFCRQLEEKRLKAVWYCNGRVNLMTREMLEAMYGAGCRGIAYGIESGNQQVLDSMKKNETLDQVRQVVKWTKEAGIHVTGYFMLGMLGETRATIRETMAFARELELDFHGFSLTTPIPGTELYDFAIKAGLINGNNRISGEWSLHANANLTRDCSDSDLTAFANEAFKEFYLKKRFGKYYFLNPVMWKEEVKVLSSIRNKEQAGELVNKARGVFSSYWHRL
ncbi:B12-binding domain-containing radical SAM protein [Chloroflexota bacterium]